MELVLCNTQSELHPLEEGIHALGSGMKQADYVRAIGKPQTTVSDKWKAARVFNACALKISSVKDAWRNLAEIHAAPEWLWSALVLQMTEILAAAAQRRRQRLAVWQEHWERLLNTPTRTDEERMAKHQALEMMEQARPHAR